MKRVQLFLFIFACAFAGNRPPVTITPRDGLITTKPAPADSSAIPATLIATCGDIRAILGGGKNIITCRHGDALAVIYGAATGSSTDPMAIKLASSTNSGSSWTTYGPFTVNLRQPYPSGDATPDCCLNSGEYIFIYSENASGAQSWPVIVMVGEGTLIDPGPFTIVELPYSDSLNLGQPGVAYASDHMYVIAWGWSRYAPQGNNHCYFWSSVDWGHIWSDPVDMGLVIDPAYGGNTGPRLRMGTNGYAAGVYINAVGSITNDGWPHFIESTDGGQTWMPPAILPVPYFDSAAGMFWWHEIDADVINNKPWLIANDLSGGGFWLYKGDGSPGNWTWTTWDLGVIGACSTYVADTLFQFIPGQYGSICHDPVSGTILITYKGVAYIVQGGSNVLCNGPAVLGVYTIDEGASWGITRPLSTWNTMTYSDWNATETAHQVTVTAEYPWIHLYTSSIWIHNTNFNLYYERGDHRWPLGVNEGDAIDDDVFQLQVAPTITVKNFSVKFNLMESRLIKMKLYDCTGRLVDNLLDRRMDAGKHELTIKTNAYPAGVYFVSLQTDAGSAMGKVHLIR